MIAAGILTGLAAAFCQSLSYLATRHFVQKRVARPEGGSSRQLLALSHVWMGIFSLLVIPLVWPAAGIHLLAILWPLLGTTVFYLLGQIGLMIALKHAEPSRVSPLLGFKIVVLAAMSTVLLQPGIPPEQQAITPMRWIAVAICVIAAVSLNYSGVALRRRALLGILIACIAYSLSDWHIGLLVAAVRESSHLSLAHASTLAACLCYALCGLIALAFLPWQGSRRPADWRDAIPFGLAWFLAMLFLFASFAIVGVVLGNILQSTRGLMSIFMATLLIRMGHHHIEPVSSRGIFFRRLVAATLMFLAVSLYLLRDSSGLRALWSASAGLFGSPG